MRSLYGKFIAFTIGIMLVSGLLAFLAVNTYYHRQLKGQNDEKNMRIAESIASYIESAKDLDLEKYLETQSMTGYKLYVVSERQVSTMYGVPFRVEDLTQDSIDRVLSGELYHGMRELPSETFVTGFFSDESANTVGVPFEYDGQAYALFLRPDIKLLFTEVHYILGGMVLIMALLSLLSMLIVARKLIEPITKLTMATKMVGEEQFTGTLAINRKDEIGQLANSFQLMTEKLGENDRIRKEFISDVSHDFQSPLLNIKGYASLLLDNELPAEERKSYALVIQSETERLSSLTKQLLLLTSLDQIASPLHLKMFSLDEQLKEIIRKHRWLLEEKGMSLSMEIDEGRYKGDPSFLEKVWENLLSNALKYTEDGGSIDIELTEQANKVTVKFSDNGIGIDQEAMGRIFDRFYRVDDSRTQEIGGTGLGLSIVQQVVKLHGGTIEVMRNKEKGTTFIVELPKL
ncbi:HAMP domain-containing sensor histidine kinase [Filibacter tadaridae]|uniref:Heme sensor protein HssS n=1 Tax=Filibacter tadaridae TaxID=2483811 RepID=A0A3P5X574_9BACL|nr:HAMP domain-containing sensor histidine kinase [Filibacter tadaridae]VDC23397.1 Heme sensor protein HssS [Filibacter tadaridae]